MKEHTINIILILVASIVCFFGGLTAGTQGTNTINESLNAELKTWKDKDSLNHAKISVIETSSAKEFTKLAINDSLVKELQLLVKDFKKQLKKSGSATIIKSTTIHDTIYKTKEVVIFKDSVGEFIRLPYNNIITNNWLAFNYSIRSDSTVYSIKVKNNYNVVIGKEKQGLFKPRKPYAEVINLNPYTTTQALRTYQVSVPKNKISIGPQVGYGITSDLKLQPYIGFGVQYNLMRF